MKSYFLALGTLLIVCVGCAVSKSDFSGDSIVDRNYYHAPPTALMARPGPMVDGPGPGVLPVVHQEMAGPGGPGGFCPPPGIPGGLGMNGMPGMTTQVRFMGPEGMQIGWQSGGAYADRQLVAPNRYNFPQGAAYRLKLASIPGRDKLVLYPSLQVYPTSPRTEAYLSHNSVPLQITDEDLDQVQSNNFVTKVIYLPDPQNQELAIAGVETLVSTRLDPGVDPIAEADRRGSIMLVLRVGNMDLEGPAHGGAVNASLKTDAQGNVVQTAHTTGADGAKGQFVPPTPIGGIEGRGSGVPGAMMMGMPGCPGQPAINPISGVTAPAWGMTVTGTPIGLPGPPHLPYGGPAGLKSHTVRNLTKQSIPKPVDHALVDVKHKPGIRLPKPVKHVQYTETHPQFRRPVVQEGGAGGDPGQDYCPPGYQQ
ncbi:MAG: hypothetical protein U0903_00345 [Planctomycetales bacterium]